MTKEKNLRNAKKSR